MVVVRVWMDVGFLSSILSVVIRMLIFVSSLGKFVLTTSMICYMSYAGQNQQNASAKSLLN